MPLLMNQLVAIPGVSVEIMDQTTYTSTGQLPCVYFNVKMSLSR